MNCSFCKTKVNLEIDVMQLIVITYVNVLFSYVGRVFRIRPISIHVFNGSIYSIRIVCVVIAMDIFPNFHVEKGLCYLEVG